MDIDAGAEQGAIVLQKPANAPVAPGALDAWPKSADGSEWDGKGLLALLASGENPFRGILDVHDLISEVEKRHCTFVIDIPIVSFGAHNYGFHLVLLDGRHLIARLSRDNAQDPAFKAPMARKAAHQRNRFEFAVCTMLEHAEAPLACRLTFFRYASPSTTLRGNKGRSLFVFEKAPGERGDYVFWRSLSGKQQTQLLVEAGKASALLYAFNPPAPFGATWMLRRAFEPRSYTVIADIPASRRICELLMMDMVQMALRKFRFGSDGLPTPPMLVASLAGLERALCELVSRILPLPDSKSLETAMYRLVLDHGDFGIHNMTVSLDAQGKPRITSVFDWEEGVIVPALLSHPKMIVTADLVLTQNGEPSIGRWGDGDSPDKMVEYMALSKTYYETLFAEAPELKTVFLAGRDARHLWNWLRAIRNGDKNIWSEMNELSAWTRAKHAEHDDKVEAGRRL